MTTLKFVHSNKITLILPHMTCNVNMILSTHTQIIRTSWYCSIRFHQGTPQNWKNHPVQIPTSCSFLLCCKEGWFYLPFPGLLMAKFPHCLQCIPLSPIPELIDDMKDSTIFTKFDIDGDSTTFALKKKTNGREGSSPLLDYLNQLSCSLGSIMDCPLSSPL